MRNECPNCNAFSFPAWKKALAFWPFSLRCRNCNARLRVKIPRWQNILVQIIGQVVFWTALLFGIRHGTQGMLVGGMLGAVSAILIAMIPGYSADLEKSSSRQI